MGYMMKGEMRKLISDTFSELIKTKDVDKITVTMLIGECHISRQTFYYHFQDMDEVMEWTVQQKGEQLLEKSMKAENPDEALEIFVSFFRENSAQLKKFMESRKRSRINKILADAISQYLRRLIERYKSPDMRIDYDDMEVMLRFYAYGMTGVLLYYSDKEPLTREKLTGQIKKILMGEMVPGRKEMIEKDGHNIRKRALDE